MRGERGICFRVPPKNLGDDLTAAESRREKTVGLK